jgi:hypothetical protein
MAFLGVCIALTAPAFANEPDSPWWDIAERGSRSLPELVQAGWEIVGFDVHNGENTVSRDYNSSTPASLAHGIAMRCISTTPTAQTAGS